MSALARSTDDAYEQEARQYVQKTFAEEERPIPESEIAGRTGLKEEEVFIVLYSAPDIDVLIGGGDRSETEPHYRPRSAGPLF